MYPDHNNIKQGQLTALKEIIDVTNASNPFWQKRFSACGIDNDIDSLEAYFEKMSFCDKNDFVADQSAIKPYGTNLSFPIENFTRISQTSGTTGHTIRWLDTHADWEWMVRGWRKIFESAGITHIDTVIFPFSFSPFIGFWLAFEAAVSLQCLTIPAANVSSSLRLKMIVENEVTCICCTPTYAIRLGQVAQEAGINISDTNLRVMILAGEPGGSIPQTRAMISALWSGVNIVDHHGMTEVGPVSYQCPSQWGKLHLMESSYITEVIDFKTNLPVGYGETGELVITTLGRFGSPVFRYKTGDMVKLANSTCECGSCEMTLDGGILGRTDDMVIIRGVNLYPSGVESVVRQCSEINEYQVKISNNNGMPEVMIEIETLPIIDHADLVATHLAEKLKERFSLRIAVKIVPSDSLPRYELKSKRWLRV